MIYDMLLTDAALVGTSYAEVQEFVWSQQIIWTDDKY